MYDQAVPLRRGTAALIIGSILLVVALVLSTMALQVGLFSQPADSNPSNWLQARFLAKSGADAFVYWLMENPDGLSDDGLEEKLTTMLNTNQGKCESVQLPSLPEGTFSVQLSRTGSLLQIHSVGQFRESSETVTVIMERTDSGAWRQVEGDT